MKKIFENKKLIIGLVVLAVILVALKVTDFNPFVSKKYGHFEKLPDMNVARAGHKLFMLKDGRVLILGGDLELKLISKINGYFGERELKTVEIFDPKTSSFNVIKSLKIDRTSYNAIMLDDGRILITGGEGKGTPQSSLIYDPIQDKLTKGPDMHFARSSHSSVKFKDGQILLIGGFIGKAGINKLFNIAEIYNPKSNKFILLKSLPNFIYRRDVKTCLLNDGRVFVVNSLKKNNNAEIFDTKTNKFEVLNIPLTSDSREFYYYLYKIIPLKNDKIVLFENDKDDFNNIKILDLKRNKLTNVGHMNLKDRGGYGVTLLKDENILITGGGIGRANFSKRVDSAEIFDTKNLKFYNLPKMKYKIDGTKNILLNDGRVLITGGGLNSANAPVKNSEMFIPSKIIKQRR